MKSEFSHDVGGCKVLTTDVNLGDVVEVLDVFLTVLF